MRPQSIYDPGEIKKEKLDLKHRNIKTEDYSSKEYDEQNCSNRVHTSKSMA